MQIHVTFRHLETSEALRDHADKKMEKFKKYLHEPIEVHLVFSVQKKIHQVAEVTIKAKHFHFHGIEESEDMYTSIDKLASKVERHLVKHKEKVKDHRALPTHEAAPLLSEN
ncbi:MAG: ribosome-associated translation inhibitor RaiA [Deltaproteobacteria bacterium]|nr:ribosome-associated translation inhibitor RaiA [Deltaproteobacteria bacterium]